VFSFGVSAGNFVVVCAEGDPLEIDLGKSTEFDSALASNENNKNICHSDSGNMINKLR
jgi:hypothetical protein